MGRLWTNKKNLKITISLDDRASFIIRQVDLVERDLKNYRWLSAYISRLIKADAGDSPDIRKAYALYKRNRLLDESAAIGIQVRQLNLMIREEKCPK